MPQADAHEREVQVPHQRVGERDEVLDTLGIARAVGEQHTVWAQARHRRQRDVVRRDDDAQAARSQLACDTVLVARVDQQDAGGIRVGWRGPLDGVRAL